jgi:hypothetical protein
MSIRDPDSEEVPRIYTSFADFERDELRRLESIPVPVAEDNAPATEDDKVTEDDVPVAEDLRPVLSTAPAARRTSTRVTPASLRAEGILEIGRATGTSALFVRTRVKLHLLHANSLPDRALDDYAVALAVNWIEDHGLPSCEVASNLGVGWPTLRLALAKAGYTRLSPAAYDQLGDARASRKLGNRRGRLVHSAAASA